MKFPRLLCLFALPLFVTSFSVQNRTEVSNGSGGVEEKIKPELNSAGQTVVLPTVANDISAGAAGGFGQSHEIKRALKWGCRFLYTPCSVLNALNPFTDTDCCVGSCLPAWSRTWYMVEWKCTPPAVDRYLPFPSEE